MKRPPLPRAFYDRDAVHVARELIGKQLVRVNADGVTAGRIVEVEAYLSREDPACHSHRGQTKRNASMFGIPGQAYVYAIHNKYCLNAVTEPEGVASAVLIRAVEPLRGVKLMQQRRGLDKLRSLARGPGRLCQAFAIDRRLYGWDLTLGKRLWIAEGEDVPATQIEIVAAPRIGIRLAAELPLRFYVAECQYVSRPLRR